jgi:hypothetical protein
LIATSSKTKVSGTSLDPPTQEGIMKKRLLLTVATFGIAAVLALPATAQIYQHSPDARWGWDNDHHDRNNSRAYEDGYRDGNKDRDHHKKWHPRGGKWKGEDHRAYEDGYRAGFGNGGQDRDHGYRH